MNITITLDEDEAKVLEKRAKKNMFTLKEQVEDIVRRSCVNYSPASASKEDIDDKLVSIFSRKRRK